MSNQFFKDLKAGLEDAIAYKKRKLDLRSELIEVPEPPIEYRAQAIKKIRETKKKSEPTRILPEILLAFPFRETKELNRISLVICIFSLKFLFSFLVIDSF